MNDESKVGLTAAELRQADRLQVDREAKLAKARLAIDPEGYLVSTETGELYLGPGVPFWLTEELREEFAVEGFAAPYCVARRKDSGERGSLAFNHEPRFYFGWEPER